MSTLEHALRRGLAAALMLSLPAAAAAQVIVSDTPVAIDNNAPDYFERTFRVDDAGVVDRVEVTVDFQAVNAGGDVDASVCESPGEGNGWANEVAFRLTSPQGTQVYLITNRTSPGHNPTYAGSTGPDHVTARVEVTFDDEADAPVGTTNNGVPESGTFRPREPLASFRGEAAAGEWRLGFQDDAHFHPLCYYSATLRIDTTDPD